MANEAGKKQFWKRNVSKVPGSIQHVYGAQHPPFDPLLHGNLTKNAPKPTTTGRAKKVSTFQEFESYTSDAWDAGDDDDDKLLAMATENLNTAVVMDSANKVIRNHSKSQVQQQESLSEDAGMSFSELPSLGRSDSQITKSTSESHIPLPTDAAIGNADLRRRRSAPYQSSASLETEMSETETSVPVQALPERAAFRLDKFKQLLAGPSTDLEELRKLSWSGIPKQVRPITWKLLSGYLPANVERRKDTLERKRTEYFTFIERYYDSRNDDINKETFRQICLDIPRMTPESLILQPVVKEIFERILFIWAIRHPASGYVQGINDILTPFFVVFSGDYTSEEDVENVDVSGLSAEVLRNIEADSFWCMSKLLDGIQDNYTFAQPGIQRKVKMLEELVSRIDEQVHQHLKQREVEYLQFAFRWMNNLLMREIPLRCTIRLWDTYQAEPESFSQLHLYVCAAFLVSWRKEILEERDFQGLLMLLQDLPTKNWGHEDISIILAEAYKLKFTFADAPNHYKKNIVRS